MYKTLIIDKNILYTPKQKLCEFVKNHFVIIPTVLFYECSTAPMEERNRLLLDLRDLMLSGAYICPSIESILKTEGHTLMPYGFLADLEGTAKLREKLKKSSNFEIKNLQKGELEKAQALLMLSESMRNQILSERPELLKEANRWQGNNGKLFKLFAEDNKNVDLHQWAQIHLKGFTHCPQRFCLSESWVSWNYLKVSAIIACSYFKKHKDPSTVQQLDKVERDLQDIKYVTLLSRADGLLSNDKSIVLPLARAVFPQKDIFCDIDEVSNAYICNW